MTLTWVIYHKKHSLSVSHILTKSFFFISLLVFYSHYHLSSSVSQYINAFAITQLFGVLCAPWNGLIMDRHKGKPLAPGKSVTGIAPACVCACWGLQKIAFTHYFLTFFLLKEKQSRRQTCAPPLCPCSWPPCSACCSLCASPFLPSLCSTSRLLSKSSIVPFSMGEMQHSLALCE